MLRIAICDDETDARDALRIQLEQVLIEETEEIVYEFSSGTNAASWLAKHPGEIDLLFLDVEMKGLNGMETAEKIRTFNRDLIIVFVTGYTDYFKLLFQALYFHIHRTLRRTHQGTGSNQAC